MFNPLAFASTAALEAATEERCGCGCTGCVSVTVDDVTVEVEVMDACGQQ